MNGGELLPDRKLRGWHATNPRAYRALFDERAALVPTMPQQYLFLQRSKTIAGEGVLGPRCLEWRFFAQPTPLSRSYRVVLVLERDGTPDVRVVDPDLRSLAGGRDLPHIYHNPDRLCLYLPGTGEWDASKRLDLTIVPRTHLWLITLRNGSCRTIGRAEESTRGMIQNARNRACRRSHRRIRSTPPRNSNAVIETNIGSVSLRL